MTVNGADNKPKAVVFASKIDGSVLMRFPSISQAAVYMNCQTNDVMRRIRQKALSPYSYMVRLESEYNGYERFKQGAYNRPIIAAYWDCIQWFATADVAGKALGFDRSMVSGYANAGRLLPGGIFVKYQVDTKEYEQMFDLASKKKELECLSTK